MGSKFYYLNKNDETEIMINPSMAWDKYESNRLEEYYIEDKNCTSIVENIVCYSKNALYVLVKSNQESLENRDRSYQNGDGFHFVLAEHKNSGEPTDEFYVIGVSPLSSDWKRAFVWYRNIDLTIKKLEKSTVKHVTAEGYTYFIVQIPWNDLVPLKPFIFDEYGFNISYVQAVPEGKNIYILEEDKYIQCEQSLRKYRVYNFEESSCTEEDEIIIDTAEKHCLREKDIHINIGINSFCGQVSNLKVSCGKKVIIEKGLINKKGINTYCIPINTGGMIEGRNTLNISLDIGGKQTDNLIEVFIYNNKMFKEIEHSILELKQKNYKEDMVKESIISLQFHYDNLINKLKKLRPYESFDVIEEGLIKLSEKIQKVQQNKDLFEFGRINRLAFKSSYDGTVQPYSIYIPESIKNNKVNGLRIYLHGSGSDDRFIGSNPLDIKLAEEKGLIMAAPFARGTSHCYCPKEALEDIKEITIKLIEIFNVDKDKVLLSGFSMGGYGVFRVYDYCPQLFRGLIVFSGHYNIANQWSIPDAVNYFEDENIEKFMDIPISIYHGKEDLNCSYEEMKIFLEKIKSINPDVDINIAEKRGHCALTEDWYISLSRWIDCNF